MKTPSCCGKMTSLLGALLLIISMVPSHQESLTGNPNHKLGRAPSQVLPRVYIYELPDIEYRQESKNARAENSTFYGLDMLLLRMLRQSPYVTSDPDKATHFIPDWWSYWVNKGGGHVVFRIMHTHPYWNRSGGSDHLFVATHDFGRCDLYQENERSILVHHFGKVSWPQIQSECNLFTRWGGECDSLLQNGLKLFRKETDIVVPPSPYEYSQHTPDHVSVYTNPDLPMLNFTHAGRQANRSNLLFYSGKIDLHADYPDAKMRPWSDAGYSFGVRQTLYHMFHDKPGFAIHSTHTHGSYWLHLTNATFCLAAAGWGWGGRYKVAVTRGCIPVIIQDGTRVEWEEHLPVHEYSVRIPLWMAHKTDKILRWYIASGRARVMQQKMECAWRMHMWRRPYGRAFEVLMCVLKRRLLGAPERIRVNWDKCAIDCGDDKWVELRHTFNNV